MKKRNNQAIRLGMKTTRRSSRSEYESLQIYFNEVKKYPLLTSQEEKEVFKKVAMGDKDAWNSAVQHNLRLVIAIASHHVGRGLDLDDLIQSGNEGLITAVNKFDLGRKCRFATHACWWIMQAIKRAIANQGRTIRVPVTAYQALGTFFGVFSDLTSELGRKPNIQELSIRMGIKSSEVELLIRTSGFVSSLDYSNGQYGKSNDLPPLRNRICQIRTLSPVSYIQAKEEIDSSHSKIALMLGLLELPCISERDRHIFKRYFGIERGGQDETLEDIGISFGLTRERVRQICNLTWKKLVVLGSPFGDEKSFFRELEKIEELRRVADINDKVKKNKPVRFQKREIEQMLQKFEEEWASLEVKSYNTQVKT